MSPNFARQGRKEERAGEGEATGWWRHIGCLLSMGHVPQMSPVISGSFAKNDMQIKASYGSSQSFREKEGESR